MCQSFSATLHRHDIDNPLCITIRRRSPNQVRATETAHKANVNSNNCHFAVGNAACVQ